MFSRKPTQGLPKPRGFRSQVELTIGEPVPAKEVSAAALEARVLDMLQANQHVHM
jgi:hypothetical protein